MKRMVYRITTEILRMSILIFIKELKLSSVYGKKTYFIAYSLQETRNETDIWVYAFVEIVLCTIITRFGFNRAYIGGSEARKQNFSHKNLCE
jgi:hypothetical protein